MKVLEIDYDKYIYPEGVSTPEEFADYLLSNTGKFIAMRYYTTGHCKDPFFVESDTAVKYINPAMVTVFRECEVTVLSREEYDRRLAEKVEASFYYVRCPRAFLVVQPLEGFFNS